MAKNNYWMKLWFEILRDPKMGRLPDKLWRRVIELFLIAGEYGKGGELPCIEDIAWILNKTPKVIITDLEKISKTGIVSKQDDDSWIVTNFQKRNEPVSASQRVNDYRARQKENERNKNCNEDVTTRYKNCNVLTEEINRVTELTELNDDNNDPKNKNQEKQVKMLFDVFQEIMGYQPVVDPYLSQRIQEMIDDKITEPEYRAALLQMRESGYECKTPASAHNWILNNRKPKKKPNARSKQAYQDEKRGNESFRELFLQQKLEQAGKELENAIQSN